MTKNRRTYIIIGVLAILVVGFAFWWRQQSQVSAGIQARQNLAKTHVSTTADAFSQALAPDFTVSKPQLIKTGCVEKSPDISLTRLYDCDATASMELTSKRAITSAQSEMEIKSVFGSLGIAPADLPNLELNGQYFNIIPGTSIAGVPPFNYYGGTGHENIGVKVESKVDEIDLTIISITVVQEYHSCKSFFLPCVKFL